MSAQDALKFQVDCIRSYRRHLHKGDRTVTQDKAATCWVKTGLSIQYRNKVSK